MSNVSVTECHSIRHYIYTILLSCTILYASIYGRVTRGSKPLLSALMYDMRGLNICFWCNFVSVAEEEQTL